MNGSFTHSTRSANSSWLSEPCPSSSVSTCWRFESPVASVGGWPLFPFPDFFRDDLARRLDVFADEAGWSVLSGSRRKRTWTPSPMRARPWWLISRRNSIIDRHTLELVKFLILAHCERAAISHILHHYVPCSSGFFIPHLAIAMAILRLRSHYARQPARIMHHWL